MRPSPQGCPLVTAKFYPISSVVDGRGLRRSAPQGSSAGLDPCRAGELVKSVRAVGMWACREDNPPSWRSFKEFAGCHHLGSVPTGHDRRSDVSENLDQRLDLRVLLDAVEAAPPVDPVDVIARQLGTLLDARL